MTVNSIAKAAFQASPRAQLEAREQLFLQLGWKTERKGSPPDQSLSLLSGGRPQIFVTTGRAPTEAVALGYSNEAPLTLVWSDNGLWLSRTETWRQTPGDSSLISIDTDDDIATLQVLEALARERVAGVLGAAQEGTIHAGLADQLAAAFSELRFRAVEADTPEFNVFRLFHQLLFVRFHEDRFGPIPGTENVASILEASDPGGLDSLLNAYAELFDSELFGEHVDVSTLPATSLLNVVKALVEPWDQLRLNFSVTASDVAGRLYQSFLASTPARSTDERLFPVALPVNRQRSRGAFYTPGPLAELVAKRCMAPLLASLTPTTPSEIRVIDPACGSGAFLLAAYRVLIEYFGDRAASEDFRIELLEQSIFGADEDETAVSLARVQLLEEAQIDRSRLPMLGDNILVANSLQIDPANASDRWRAVMARGGFDAILSNPPFHTPAGAQRAGIDTAALRKRFEGARGTGANIAYAFLDLARSWVSPNGRVSMLLPHAVLDGPSGEAIRDSVGANLVEVIDFGHNELFSPAMSYVAAVTLNGRSHKDLNLTRVTSMNRNAQDIKDDLESVLEVEDQHGTHSSSAFRIISTCQKVLATHSWSPFVARWRELADQCLGVQFEWFGQGDSPRVAIGTQTGDDSRFVLGPDRWTESDGVVTIDGVLSIPAAFAPWWVRGSSIRPFAISSLTERVVVPRMGEDPRVDEVIQKLGGVPASFRPGDLAALRSAKVIVRSLFDEPAAVGDRSGETMIPQGGAGAVALIPRRRSQVPLLEALCNSSLYQWLFAGLAHIKSRGYSQLMRHHWAFIPWPRLDTVDARRIVAAGSDVRRTLRLKSASRVSRYWSARMALDEIVFDALDASSTVEELVQQELWRRP